MTLFPLAILIFVVAATVRQMFFVTGAGGGDIQRLEARYRRRGRRVLEVRRIGTSWSNGSLVSKDLIRKYEVVLEGPDGRPESRVIGVAEGEARSVVLWRYDAEGRRHLMFD